MAKPSDSKQMGKRIAEARKRRGLNPNQLARRAGISWANLVRYEEGKNEPGAGRLLRIADVLGVTVDWLLGRRGAPEREEPVTHLDLPDEDPEERIVGRVVWAYQPFV